MLGYYGQSISDPATGATARQFVRVLRADEQTMLVHVQALRYSRYALSYLPGKPARYKRLLDETWEPYLYASRRYLVPFGWHANPLPSTCATAWMIMVADDYDPLGIDGAPN
jgi:hypothetical protein